jgi:hypothetical protein
MGPAHALFLLPGLDILEERDPLDFLQAQLLRFL